MFQFDPQAYGEACAPLLQCQQPRELGLGTANRSVFAQLSSLDEVAVFGGRRVQQPDMALCCISALWLLHGYLDESHQISQSVHTSTGSYWHAIMHRREGDFPNSKYWFRRTGTHLIFEPLVDAARELAMKTGAGQASDYLIKQATWDPYRFVDLCESALDHADCEMLARQAAQVEWQLLFDFCYRQSAGL